MQSDDKSDWIASCVDVYCSRGARLTLHRVISDTANVAPSKAPVLLAHGTFSNHRTCGGLARYLSALGHDCWLVDFEGHGHSGTVKPTADFEALFLSGTEAALLHVGEQTGQKIHWIGHSGGGLAALMLLARYPQYTTMLQSLVTLGSQACNAGHTSSARLTLRLFRTLTMLLGFVPAKRIGLGPENEHAKVMLQWYRWNLAATWQGYDGFDYLHALEQHPQLTSVPVFSIAGTGDGFIAPPTACLKLHELLPSNTKNWLECGIAQGFSEDFSHARLISSRTAAREIWPRIGDWLLQMESTEAT